MAIASSKVTAEVVDAGEFPDMARRFSVGPVPKTVINEQIELVGALPEAFLLEKILGGQ